VAHSQTAFQDDRSFCGGGTLSAAIASNADFTLIAGVELEPKYADVWQQAHPRAVLYQADIRRIHTGELPAHDILIASIPAQATQRWAEPRSLWLENRNWATPATCSSALRTSWLIICRRHAYSKMCPRSEIHWRA